jgi:hypothetical protein
MGFTLVDRRVDSYPTSFRVLYSWTFLLVIQDRHLFTCPSISVSCQRLSVAGCKDQQWDAMTNVNFFIV